MNTCVIIEDEPLAMEKTKAYVSRIPYLKLEATFDSALEALGFLGNAKPDILFLDINMDGLSGIKLLESAHIESEVIITTAYDQYAMKGFELSVTDYLLKPFTFERFVKAVEKARQNLTAGRTANSSGFVFIKTENRLEKIFMEDILYIEGMRDYRRIHCRGKTLMTLQTFNDLEKDLAVAGILRVHKSWMVSLSKIDFVERDRIRIDGEHIPISETYRNQFLAKINHEKK